VGDIPAISEIDLIEVLCHDTTPLNRGFPGFEEPLGSTSIFVGVGVSRYNQRRN
jgi:hypothetical protein